MNFKFLTKTITTTIILFGTLSSVAFATGQGSSTIKYNEMTVEMKEEVKNLNLSTNTTAVVGKYVEYTYDTAPINIRSEYEEKCRENGIVPMGSDKIMAPTSSTRNYLVDTSDIKVYRDTGNRILKFYYQRLWYTFPLDTTLVGYNHISRGKEVAMLQFLLNEWGYNAGNLDEIFGSRTYSSLITYQKTNGLVQDGIAGVKTWMSF